VTILPLTYLGGVEWFVHLAGGDAVIDVGENWVKQTARNRCEILTANGVATLTVPVHGYGQKIATKEVRIDNSRRWTHTHWVSLVSAYRNSPFFDHYEELFAPVYERQWDFLIDMNLELLGRVTDALGLRGAVRISREYVTATPGDVDMRGKKVLRRPADTSTQNPIFKEYIQVFADRAPFTAGLSVVDLLFCEGPSARELLPPQDRR
jgi:hypothetical protein